MGRKIPPGRVGRGEAMKLASILIAIAALAGASPAAGFCMYKGELYAKTTLEREFADARYVVRARVLSERSASSSGWLPGAPPGQATPGLRARNSGSRKMLTGLLITAGLPPDR
mgnify:CR=1 FL=1